jgi:hypothetical protein
VNLYRENTWHNITTKKYILPMNIVASDQNIIWSRIEVIRKIIYKLSYMMA